MSKQPHPFARTLGPGPYRFIGFGQIHISETFGAKYVGPQVDSGAGTCAHCGHGIINIFVIKTAENKTFGIGSDCILKMREPVENISELQARAKQFKREQGKARREKQRQLLRAECADLVEQRASTLATIKPSFTCQWANMLDYAQWYLRQDHKLGGYRLLKARILEVAS